MKGPRIVFKDDRDSRVGRGCHLHAGHFRPEMAKVIYEAALTAPREADVMVVSEGWRHIRDSRDLHEEGRAFDLSLNIVTGLSFDQRKTMGTEWSNRLRAKLGRDYDVIVHGDGGNLHIHVELDP
jgi:hypothetical protein